MFKRVQTARDEAGFRSTSHQTNRFSRQSGWVKRILKRVPTAKDWVYFSPKFLAKGVKLSEYLGEFIFQYAG